MQKPENLSDEQLNELYNWIDEIDFSRPKKNIARDFSDCLLTAELIKHYIPRLVSLHNYPSSHNLKQKTTNWATLNSTNLSWTCRTTLQFYAVFSNF